jgi:hypothetical protein
MLNDGITSQLDDFLNGLETKVPEAYVEALKEVIDEEFTTFSDEIKRNTPVDTGELKKSFSVEKIDHHGRYYGYRAEFKGNNAQGVPYEKLANILNYGATIGGKKPHVIAPTFFISKAIRKLKGMDGRIEARASAKVAKAVEGLADGK